MKIQWNIGVKYVGDYRVYCAKSILMHIFQVFASLEVNKNVEQVDNLYSFSFKTKNHNITVNLLGNMYASMIYNDLRTEKVIIYINPSTFEALLWVPGSNYRFYFFIFFQLFYIDFYLPF